MKKILMTILCAMFFTFGMVFSANALTIVGDDLAYDPWIEGTNYWTGTETSQNEIDAIVLSKSGYSEELYKSDVGQSDSGTYPDWYTTEYYNTPTDPTEAIISWLGPGVIDQDVYLLVKDGKGPPGWYLFWLSHPAIDWDGMKTINLKEFWLEGNGAISHVTLYGGYSEVPEPGMVILLGIGLIGLAFYNRKRLLN